MGARAQKDDWPLGENDQEREVQFWKSPYREIVNRVKEQEKMPPALPSVSDQTLERMIRIADFTKDVEILPKGLETLTGEQGIALSGGQKQRISIARALLANPEVLILDDCLSAVDAMTEKNVLQSLREERKGRTTLVSSHRLSAVRDADLILVLENGAIAAQGTHKDLIEQGGWYAEQFELQQLEEETKTQHEEVR